MTRNARAPIFRPSWLPSRAQRLAAFRAEQQRYNPRPSAYQRGYDAEWTALRKAHLLMEPNCRMCAALGRDVPAAIVDHIEPIRDAPHRRLDPSNFQALCIAHHQSKTQKERYG
jgi:5-methylcytosine-specific restriction protein A